MASNTNKKHPDKHSSSGTVNSHLRNVIASTKRTLRAICVFSFVINMLVLAVPLYLLQIYDKVLPNRSTDTLLFLTGMVLIALMTFAILDALRRGILVKLGAWFEEQLGEHLLSSALERSVDKNSSSTNVLRDLTRIRNFLSGSSLLAVLDCPWSPIFIAILFVIHPLIGMLALLGGLFLFGLAYANERLTRQIVRDADDVSRQSMDNAAAFTRNADVIKVMGMQPTILKRWRAGRDTGLALSFGATKRGARLSTIAKFTRLLLQVGVICLAAWLILHGQLTPGAIIASVLLMRQAISPVERVIRSWKTVIKTRKAFNNVNRYLDNAPSLQESPLMPEPEGSLAAKRISFRLKNPSRSVFSRISFKVKPGESVALVGSTAAGKTSLARVLVGAKEPTSGRVTLGGFDLSKWRPEHLGPYIGYLPQDVELFAGTIRENIERFQDGNIEAVIEAAKLANVHEVIQDLPEGYDTEIGVSGVYLSGGQRQRIALARAVYGNPRLIILDEPDASLDSEGRAALASAVEKLKQLDAIIILITHDPSVCEFVDRVFELKDGHLSISQAKDARSEENKLVSIKSKRRRRKNA